jgi:hypothetical protein
MPLLRHSKTNSLRESNSDLPKLDLHSSTRLLIAPVEILYFIDISLRRFPESQSLIIWLFVYGDKPVPMV